MSFFWVAGLPWRVAFARTCPMTWAAMERAAYARHVLVFGDPHRRLVRAFYRGETRARSDNWPRLASHGT